MGKYRGASAMSDMVCYCFEYTVEDIETDVWQHGGESTILAKILEEKKKGACQCSVKNPKGT
jgi:hypothetical protein